MTNQQYSALFHDPKWVNEALRAGNTGLWKITLYPEQERYEMVGNETMLELLGLDVHPEPGVCYQHWHERISPAYESQVVECVERIVSNHYAEVEYPWEHPVLGRIHIRCGGRLVGNHGNWFEIMGYHQDISEIQTMREQLAQSLSQLDQANHDALTGLPNRRLLSDRLTQAMAQSKRSGTYGAVLFLDLDNFKPLNDEHGHAAGDLLLIEVADRLHDCVREIDTVARFGGDEFVVVLGALKTTREGSLALANNVAEKISAVLSRPYHLAVRQHDGTENVIAHSCTSSIGGALFFDNEARQEEVLKRADSAMYRAKNEGRNRIRFAGVEDRAPVLEN